VFIPAERELLLKGVVERPYWVYEAFAKAGYMELHDRKSDLRTQNIAIAVIINH